MFVALQTANSKGYAFVEFEYDDVARIAAETMNNYLMFGKLLKCEEMMFDWCTRWRHRQTDRHLDRSMDRQADCIGL